MSTRIRFLGTSITKRALYGRLITVGVTILMLTLVACQPATSASNTPTKTLLSVSPSVAPLKSEIPPVITFSPTFTASITATNPQKLTTPSATSTYMPIVTKTPSPEVVFAAIGDYGSGDQSEGEVADLIKSWQPDFIITLGDNNYPIGSAGHIDEAIGQFFHSFIYPYTGSYGPGADVNRFFPCLGNHDVQTDYGQPYYDYFTLPGNERYYDFTWGPVHLFALDNIETEPDGVGETSVQAEWLKAGLAASNSPWNIVYMHYAPYSSGPHGSITYAQWPYGEWGAEAVLSAHDHTYERLLENGLVYFVNGVGGAGRYNFVNIVDGSQMRYNAEYGAMKITASETRVLFEFIDISGEVVDTYELTK